MWRAAYESNLIKGHVYDDVLDALKRWTASSDRSVCIYSSGSVEAQILLFKYSEQGDLTTYLSGHYGRIHIFL